MSRKMTLVIDADMAESHWIWESFKDRKKIHGIEIKSIAEGDHLKIIDDFLEGCDISKKDLNY